MFIQGTDRQQSAGSCPMRAIPGLDPKAPVMTGAIPSDCDAHDTRPI
jgi:hypothetical protein